MTRQYLIHKSRICFIFVINTYSRFLFYSLDGSKNWQNNLYATTYRNTFKTYFKRQIEYSKHKFVAKGSQTRKAGIFMVTSFCEVLFLIDEGFVILECEFDWFVGEQPDCLFLNPEGALKPEVRFPLLL